MASPAEQIEEEIKKAQAWYGQRYRKSFIVHRRYDKVEKHWSWQIITDIGGQERVMRFGLSEKSALFMIKHNRFSELRFKVLDYIKQTLIKAQVKWEPGTLAVY